MISADVDNAHNLRDVVTIDTFGYRNVYLALMLVGYGTQIVQYFNCDCLKKWEINSNLKEVHCTVCKVDERGQ